ncbi:MAG: alpha/beta hydrolase [Verrucomicrobium sp.]|nr:alpha/beta hydrolase [Verrucomicrobium sp.]
MPRTRFYLFINGILTVPDGRTGWTDRAVTWTESHFNQLAEKYEYFCGALTRRLFQWLRVKRCVELLRHYSGHDLVLVGHSNGADIVCRILKEYPEIEVAEIHLVAAAADADFQVNGLNMALLTGRLGRATLYGSHRDGALRLAQVSEAFSFLGLGYGALGRTGPRNVDERIGDRVVQVWRDDFDHSTWFSPAQFAATMDLIVQPSRA